MDYEVFFFSNLTFLEIPPSDLCFVQEAIFYDYFSKCIIFLCILLKNKNVSDSMTSMAVGLCSHKERH